MNKIKEQLYLFCFLITGTLLVGACGEKVEPSEPIAKKVAAQLAEAEWVASSVQHEEDGDLSESYADFRLKFSADLEEEPIGGAFEVENGQYAFPASGSWAFANESDYETIIRNDGVEMKSTLSVERGIHMLRLEFELSTPASRLKGTSGHFVFNLEQAP